MEGWKTEKFKKLIDYKSGYTWSKEQELAVEEPNSIRVLTVSNVQDKLDLTSELYLAGVSEQDKIKKQVSKDWSIAVSSNGNRNRIGNAIFIDSDTNYLFASFLTAFKPFDEADILPYYFYLWLSSSFVQRKITSVAEGTTGLGNLSIRFLRNMDITFPTDKAEQTAIAKILSTVDEAIRSTRETISKLERVKKSLMQNLLSGKMKPDGTLRPAAEFYEDEKMGLVPKGWTVKTIKDISLQVTDGEHQTPNRSENGVYLLSARNVKNGFLDLLDVDYVPENEYIRLAKRCNPEVDDILISCSGTIGNVCIVPSGFKGVMVRSAALVKFEKNKILPKLAELILQSHGLQIQMKNAVSSSVQGNLFQGAIKKLRMVFPEDLTEQKKIADKLKIFDSKIQQKQEKITALELLKKSLMQQLLTGRVRINEQCTINNVK